MMEATFVDASRTLAPFRSQTSVSNCVELTNSVARRTQENWRYWRILDREILDRLCIFPSSFWATSTNSISEYFCQYGRGRFNFGNRSILFEFCEKRIKFWELKALKLKLNTISLKRSVETIIVKLYVRRDLFLIRQIYRDLIYLCTSQAVIKAKSPEDTLWMQDHECP